MQVDAVGGAADGVAFRLDGVGVVVGVGVGVGCPENVEGDAGVTGTEGLLALVPFRKSPRKIDLDIFLEF
mgnify:CR=1 FL=1